MIELHEFLGRDIDPIGDIRKRFESFYTESYFHPSNGDWISDDYFRIIDLTTKPTPLSEKEHGKLARSIVRLNEKPDTLLIFLGGSSLLDAYNDVAAQINAINLVVPGHDQVPAMQTLPANTAEQ